jgi:Domain of unknown function (DUF1840)
MLYKFKSKAAGDVIMLQANGDQVLRILGKEPAAKGIIEAAAMPAAMAALEAAIISGETAPNEPPGAAPESTAGADRVSLRQRAWPLVEMMKRAHAAGEPIVWGV